MDGLNFELLGTMNDAHYTVPLVIQLYEKVVNKSQLNSTSNFHEINCTYIAVKTLTNEVITMSGFVYSNEIPQK